MPFFPGGLLVCEECRAKEPCAIQYDAEGQPQPYLIGDWHWYLKSGRIECPDCAQTGDEASAPPKVSVPPWNRPNDHGEMPGDICCMRATGKRCYEHDPTNYTNDPYRNDPYIEGAAIVCDISPGAVTIEMRANFKKAFFGCLKARLDDEDFARQVFKDAKAVLPGPGMDVHAHSGDRDCPHEHEALCTACNRTICSDCGRNSCLGGC